ncbi:MAG: undecaprenyl-diphosphate phosphatase [Bacteroidota bacterium]
MSILQAVILAIVEGLTEFLPVSSTGHMIIASSMMGIASDNFVKMFTVAIQLGAILSVIVLYWRKFLQSIQFYITLIVAFIPAAVFGKLFNDQIDALLENALVVGISLLLGGIVLLFIDKWFGHTEHNDEVTYPKAFKIGMFQVIAMIPGVSRSAATIIGALQQKLSRQAAAEFSFFLAVPTMFAATAYKLYKYIKEGGSFGSEEITVLAIGNVVAFIVAMIAIKAFISYLTKYGFKIFGWYRIIVGAIIIALYAMGYNLEVI